MLKLAALGALGFFGYKFYRQNALPGTSSSGNDAELDLVAGGPLSAEASVQSSPDLPDTK